MASADTVTHLYSCSIEANNGLHDNGRRINKGLSIARKDCSRLTSACNNNAAANSAKTCSRSGNFKSVLRPTAEAISRQHNNKGHEGIY